MRDCFAYRNKRCTILTIKKCEGEKCVFYKTKEQFDLDQERAMERILSLDKDLQYHINETYYGGKMGGNENEC